LVDVTAAFTVWLIAVVRKLGDFMSNTGTLTRADLSEHIHKGIGLSRTDCYKLVDTILDLMTSEIERGADVKISSFGTFHVREKSARIGRNPKTGVEVQITPRRVLTFKPSQKLRERIAKGD
jgi:integration host factor subunit alpha